MQTTTHPATTIALQSRALRNLTRAAEEAAYFADRHSKSGAHHEDVTASEDWLSRCDRRAMELGLDETVRTAAKHAGVARARVAA